MLLPLLATTTGDTVLELGPVVIERQDIDAVTGNGLRILLLVVLTFVVVRVLYRLIDRLVTGVRDGPRGGMGRFWTHDQVVDADRRDDEIALQRRVRRAEAIASVARSVVAATLWTLSTLAILSTIGIQLGPYIAGLGIVGVALGFGAQDLVKDFVSGLFMLLEDQYGLGDVVDAGEASGVVEGVSLRTTRLRDVHGTLWFVPNGEIRRLGNMSQGWARALLDIGVAYDTDLEHAERVIAEVAERMAEEPAFESQFLDAPAVWGVERLGADSIDIRLVIQTTPGDQWAISRELRRRIKDAFDEQGIEIPFPQRTLWVRDGDGTPLPGREGELGAVGDDVGRADGSRAETPEDEASERAERS